MTASGDRDEALAARLRDLSLVDLDALTAGSADPRALVSAFADDVADALHAARNRMAEYRAALGGTDPLIVVDTTARQRGSEAGGSAGARTQGRLRAQAEAARSLARLSELASGLAPKLFEADRRR
ncbi:MAG: hypothetical protein AB7O24_23030 [Kofleriaceae bacterium]